MELLRIIVFVLLEFYVCDANGDIPSHNVDDSKPTQQVPKYLKNTKYAKTHGSGTKSAYGGGGTKSGYGGTKTVYGGSKHMSSFEDSKSYTGSKTWESDFGSGFEFGSFKENANLPFQSKCEPECKNNGICVDQNTCHCPANFFGTYCEFHKKPCLTYPPMPMNSRSKCSAEQCTITCRAGHKFIDGSTIAELKCAEGQWVPTRADLSSIPDCEPVCEPACLNGGVCLSANTCQCPEDYRGAQCQFAASVCDYRKLGFNGAYTCHSDGEGSRCSLSCAAGSTFSSEPAEEYTCLYATGRFEPQPVPHCVFNDAPMLTAEESYHKSGLSNVKFHSTASAAHAEYGQSQFDFNNLQVGHNHRGFSQEAISEEAHHKVAHYQQTHGEEAAIQEAHYQQAHYQHTHSEEAYIESHHGFQVSSSNQFGKVPTHVVVEDLSPKGGICMTWANTHYKTFDGFVYSFESPCRHILVRDSMNQKYSIAVKADKCKTSYYCPAEITIDVEGKEYVLRVAEDGSVIFRTSHRTLPVPATLPGIRVTMPSDTVIVTLDSMGVTLNWDTDNLIVIEATVQQWNATEGLCGVLDGDPSSDLVMKDHSRASAKGAFVAAWTVENVEEPCDKPITENSACLSQSDEDMQKARQFCNNIFTKDKFKKCAEAMNVSTLLEACEWDYCACTNVLSPEECACKTVSVYAKECLRHGVEELRFWRDQHTCPMHCGEGKVYKACGPDVQPSCAFPQLGANRDQSSCVEGCFCPEGLLMEGGRCIQKRDCPCRLRNRIFRSGATVSKDCNTCTCENGEWKCTQIPCGARCGVMGDPHYITFDGVRFDFMGHCTYYLLKSDGLDVQVENVACSGAITEAMNLSPYKGEGRPSCTKAVYITYDGISLHLKQGGLILANGKELTSLPANIGEVVVRAASSMFVIVQLPNGVDLWWDGQTRVFVDVPAAFNNKTKGLCGTFNLNQQDDFLTPEGDIEQATVSFGNKWKSREFCTDVATAEPQHPCRVDTHKEEAYAKYCDHLKSALFKPCHWDVEVTPYYDACMYDVCACADDISKCFCPIVGDYAMACAAKGINIQWRYNVKECEVHCGGGQEYTVCADSCTRTCADVALLSARHCAPKCVEGCACPAGQVLDDKNNCVPTGLCPCYHKGIKFNAGYKEVRAGRRERELCTCIGAQWSCSPATELDIQNYPPAEEMQQCSSKDHMEFTSCLLAEPRTCKNMHLQQSSISSECRPGCQCKKDYVLDLSTKRCVAPNLCPCHHGGRSYPDGHSITELCNTCECKSGNWSCTQSSCQGVCTLWGDSHVITFDGATYEFQGTCSYVMAKGVGFHVEIQNVPCGTTGATCSKSTTLKVGDEVVTLGKHEQIADFSTFKKIKLREVGAYVFLDVPSLGISVQWDRATRVNINVDAMWKGRLKGLCGNFNMDMRDDFQTPSSGGIAESSAIIFADSWKTKPTCAKPEAVKDHCKQRPERKDWAINVCSVLKKNPFSKCHSEVPPGSWISWCEAESCACDSGEDCACACGALAAYAAACAQRGLFLRWRTPALCPMQCDGECSNYEPCINACPLETCDNTLVYEDIKTSCQRDTCVEGCQPKKTCPPNEVFTNSSFTECKPRSKCRTVCLTLDDGTVVLEGEVMEQDACHVCSCSKGVKICTGQPCFSTELPPAFTEVPLTSTTVKPQDEALKCTTGWTQWISSDTPHNNTKGESIDDEPLPKITSFTQGQPMCDSKRMKNIECRQIDSKVPSKDTGLNVECSLEKGLVCNENRRECPDFEIRVYCDCEDVNATDEFQCLNSLHPSHPHRTNCAQFYECTPDALNPAHAHTVLKTCGEGLLYNPVIMVCDWPASVLAVRPECGKEIEHTSTTTAAPTTPSSPEAALCPPGQVYRACAYACDKLCDHFKKALIAKGKCRAGQKCIEGCVDETVANTQCDYGALWRDERTCVPIRDCTCYSKDGRIVKPGGVETEGCEKCQCLDNVFHCDLSECVAIEVPLSGVTHQSIIFTAPTFTTITTTPTIPVATTVATTIPTTSTTESVVTTTQSTKTTAFSTTAGTLSTVFIIKSTTTPPPQCDDNRYVNLLWGADSLPDATFSASSSASTLFEPQNAVLNAHSDDTSAGSWNPATQDTNQYIQVELVTRQPIYGIVLQGSPLFDQYVTSYEVLYGDDGVSFHEVLTETGGTKIFRGPIDHTTPMKQTLNPAIEAKFIRIRPMTWHEEIAVRLELIGCGKVKTTTHRTPTTVTTQTPPLCTDVLGIAAGLPIENIEVSSNNELRKHLSLTSDKGWRPIYSTPGEWVMFDFTSPRNITGIKTKGGKTGWVTSYQILYTSDLSKFNPIVDELKFPMAFPANFDGNTAVFNEFERPIHARYLKVVPLKWKDHIDMRIEPIGCFVSYPVTASITNNPTAVTIKTQASCDICPGAYLPLGSLCECAAPNRFYSQDGCTTRDMCPCYLGHMAYAVGASFRNSNCEECICKLGGVTDCKPIKECQCDTDLVPELTKSTCDCKCVPCPNGTKICPTSQTCLSLDKWCDGLQDCPDDETDCTRTASTGSSTGTSTTRSVVVTTSTTVEPVVVTNVASTVGKVITTTQAPKVDCPIVECPPGYYVIRIPSRQTGQESQRPRFSYQRYLKGSSKSGKGYSKGGSFAGGYSKGGYRKGYSVQQTPQLSQNQAFTLSKPLEPTSKPATTEQCVQFKCVPKPKAPGSIPVRECAAPQCPDDYSLKLEVLQADRCPQYTCVPPPEKPSFCELTGRTITTFDGAQYKFDVCFHILARENQQDLWTVLVRKKCRIEGCLNEVLIRQDDQLILIKPDLMIEYENYEYTVEQTNLICFQKNSFEIDRLGEGLVVRSRKYNFTVFYNCYGDVKIGVLKSHQGSVDGLCGVYDGLPTNERPLPAGGQAVSLTQFAAAWAKPGLSPAACEANTVDVVRQKRAWELCGAIVKEPLSRCSEVLSLDKWRGICLEKLCACAETTVNGTKRTYEQCRCILLEQFVAECLAEKDVLIPDWRLLYNCPADCPAPLVHKDCYRRSCEPSCTVTNAKRECPVVTGQCVPGCYCPEGMLRRMGTCVSPTQCMDCVCNNMGAPSKYVTFEREELPFVGNCTYLASRDRNNTGHTYELYVTNGGCEENPNIICTKVIHLITGNNIVKFEKDPLYKELQMTVNDERIYKQPLDKDWIKTSASNKDVTVILPEAHAELTIQRERLEFSLKVPSYLYTNATEGLCGLCAGTLDHLVTSNGTITDSIEEYGNSWRTEGKILEKLKVSEEEQCSDISQQEEDCILPPPEKNPCYNILNAEKFGACHALVDPQPYISSCEVDICSNSTDICGVLARYASECRSHGVCTDWRTDLCPITCESPLVYKHCVACERTCDNYELYDKQGKTCTQQPIEGCFCPDDKVRVNNTCIEPSKCFPCDAEKLHYVGEEWQESACKKCTCNKLEDNSVHISCTEQSCSTPVCRDTELLLQKPQASTQCCPDYVCVPKPRDDIQCKEAKVINCAKDQVLKQNTDDNGCTQYACECKPQSECPEIPLQSDVELIEPGMQRVVDNSSCCPTILMVCQPDSCPLPPVCPQHYELSETNVPGVCCKEYKCELPKNKCVVTLEWEASPKGGEKSRDTLETVLKDLDSAWLDGPCRSCTCQSSPLGGAVASCSVTSCEPIASSDQFVLEPVTVPFACCAQTKEIACVYKDRVYKPGEGWNNPDDVCETFKCIEVDDGKLQRVNKVKTCDTACQPGFNYTPSSDSAVCCGTCKPVACIVNGIEHFIEDNWLSDDYCTNFTCVDNNGTLQVKSVKEECPQYTEEYKKNFVVREISVLGQCCKKSEVVACRVENNTYQENETWQSDDPCKNITCVRDESGQLSHVPSMSSCPVCGPATKEVRVGNTCCPECQPTACLVDGVEKDIGSTWYSEDNCTTFSCDRNGDGVMVSSSRAVCPDVTGCKPERLYNDTCCVMCRKVADDKSTCSPVAIPPHLSVGTVRLHLHTHGWCRNKHALKDFRECRGACDSGTLYNNRTGAHDSLCQCCQVTRYQPIEVSLSCEDGAVHLHRVASPAECACRQCGGAAFDNHPQADAASVVTEEYEIPEIYQRFKP